MINVRETKIIDDEIDLADLVRNTDFEKPTLDQQKAISEEAKKTGFISREPRKMGRPRTSPYKAQFGGRCREGMKELFKEIGMRLNTHDTVTLELAILALIEQEHLDDIKVMYENITNR